MDATLGKSLSQLFREPLQRRLVRETLGQGAIDLQPPRSARGRIAGFGFHTLDRGLVRDELRR